MQDTLTITVKIPREWKEEIDALMIERNAVSMDEQGLNIYSSFSDFVRHSINLNLRKDKKC